MGQTVFISLNQITQVHKKDVFLADIGDVYCSDPHVASRVKAVKITSIRENREHNYIGNVLDVIEKIQQASPGTDVSSMGETDFIISYKPDKAPSRLWEWTKTAFACLICFFGAMFAIMTFNNDANVKDVFQEIYRLVMIQEPDGVTVLELAYSVGLALGVTVFFNHFSSAKLNLDPTPLEVEMRLYEDNVNKTLIQNSGRKESGNDVT